MCKTKSKQLLIVINKWGLVAILQVVKYWIGMLTLLYYKIKLNDNLKIISRPIQIWHPSNGIEYLKIIKIEVEKIDIFLKKTGI